MLKKGDITYYAIESGDGVGFDKNATLWVRPEDADKVTLDTVFESHNPWQRTATYAIPFGVEVFVSESYRDETRRDVTINRVTKDGSVEEVYYASSDQVTEETTAAEYAGMWGTYEDIVDGYKSAGYQALG